MSSEIKSKIQELLKIEEKLKELRGKIKKYTDRKNNLMTELGTYMTNNGHSGIKCKELGCTILAENTIKTNRKTKNKQKEALRLQLLENGIRMGDDALEDLLKSIKGEAEDHVKIKIKKNIK